MNQRSVPVSSISETVEAELVALSGSNSNYKRLDRTVLLAMLAARNTLRNFSTETDRWGVNIGSSRGATGLFEAYHNEFLNEGQAHTLSSPTTTLGNVSTWVAQDQHLKGMTLAHSVTCATAMHAVLNGIAWLKADMADAMLVGGTEAPLTPFTIAQMEALKLYTKQEGPFPCRALDLDKSTNTMVLGEAAATAVLIKGKHPDAQAMICGYGWGSEPLEHHTSLSKQADCFQSSMTQALDGAGLQTVDAVIMHAPGTVLGDQAELAALKKVFGDRLPFLTSNKSMVGHTLGTSGMLSMELGVLFLNNNKLVADRFYDQAIEQSKPVKTVMVNAVGFGGNAVSIILCLP